MWYTTMAVVYRLNSAFSDPRLESGNETLKKAKKENVEISGRDGPQSRAPTPEPGDQAWPVTQRCRSRLKLAPGQPKLNSSRRLLSE
jgi:hypothetical protein